MQDKPIELGENLIIRHLDAKTLISGQIATRLKQGDFMLEGEHIEIRAGQGVKISSIHPNILVISTPK